MDTTPRRTSENPTDIPKSANDVLRDLLEATLEIKRALISDPTADITSLLDRRDRDCKQLESLSRYDTDCAPASELTSERQSMAHDIMRLQAECETILRERLQQATDALRESIQRRRLDAAYGPVRFTNSTSPRFLDRQQ